MPTSQLIHDLRLIRDGALRDEKLILAVIIGVLSTVDLVIACVPFRQIIVLLSGQKCPCERPRTDYDSSPNQPKAIPLGRHPVKVNR